MPTKNETKVTELTLSAAILAPLNAIFEAQIHAARAFLNFILQMGFKHRFSPDELLHKIKEIKIQLQNEEDDKQAKRFQQRIDEYQELYDYLILKEEIGAGQKLSKQDEEKLAKLHDKLLKKDNGEIYTQEFNYTDENNIRKKIVIPNLALIPVKPLAIKDASYNFKMSLNRSYKNYRQMQQGSAGDEPRPWYLLQPKSLSGEIIPESDAANQTCIQVEVNVGEVELPQGLNNLLISLTQSAEVKDK